MYLMAGKLPELNRLVRVRNLRGFWRQIRSPNYQILIFYQRLMRNKNMYNTCRATYKYMYSVHYHVHVCTYSYT